MIGFRFRVLARPGATIRCYEIVCILYRRCFLLQHLYKPGLGQGFKGYKTLTYVTLCSIVRMRHKPGRHTMIKRLTSLSSIFVLTGLVFSLANVPSALGAENHSAHWLAQSGTSGNASGEMRSTGKLGIGPAGVFIFFYSGENTGIPQTAKTFISGVARDLTEEEAKSQ